MAKTIKFNLICDGKPVRTIEDLQNNFSIEDILDYYDNQLLHRWLRVRGYDKELEEVNAIIDTDPMNIIKELIRIFNIAGNEEKVEESIYILQHQKERRDLLAIYEKENYQVAHIIDEYEAGYRQLVDDILANPEDAAKIKADIAEIVSSYDWVLKLDHKALFDLLNEKSVLAIMCLLMNEKSRDYYLPIKEVYENEDGSSKITWDIEHKIGKKSMYNTICRMIEENNFAEKLGENLVSFAGETDGYWKDLEPKGKKYMIISMDYGDYVRAAGESGGDLSQNDVKHKFVIVNGIDYKSNSKTHKLLYMEV